MSTEVSLDRDGMLTYLGFVFASGDPWVVEAQAWDGLAAQRFSTPEQMLDFADAFTRVAHLPTRPDSSVAFTLWFPATGGRLDALPQMAVAAPGTPPRLERTDMVGWGTFRLTLWLQDLPQFGVGLTSPSLAHATAFERTQPSMAPTSQWDWPTIQRLGQRLTRKLRALDQGG